MPPVSEKTEEIVPRFQRIENALRARVADGTWAVGQALPSRSRLCVEFSTTRVTLDRAVSGLVRAGLLHSARGSGTFVAQAPDHAATTPSLHFAAPPRALRIGVMLEQTTPDSTPEEGWNDNFYFGPLFQGIRDGLLVRPVETLHAHLPCAEYGAFYQNSGLDGMILIAFRSDDLPVLRRLAAEGVRFVATGISSSDPADALLPCVDTDNVRGASEAVRHLLGLGHTRIALVNLATANANHAARLEGYRRTMAAAGAAVSPADMVLFPTHDSGQFEDQIEDWLLRTRAAGPLPTAIFACDYLMALATLRVLRRHGLCVPEDVSLVAFDDPLSAAHLTPPLTTIRQPAYRLGRRAALRLLQSLPGETRPQGMEILPVELIVRESTRRLGAAHTTERV